MDENKLISIIIPVYNTGDLLIRCIKSIVHNDYKKIEVIIVNDGSNYETSHICDKCMDMFSNIIVYHCKNKGVSVARNYGVEKSTGDYVMFVDADDTIETTAISELYHLCEGNCADFGMVGYRECYPNNTYRSYHYQGNQLVLEGQDILVDFLMENQIGWNVWGKIYKRELIEKIKFPLNMRVAEDMYFVYQVCVHASRYICLNKVLYNYYKLNESAMSDNTCNKFFDTYKLIKKVWNEEKVNKSKRIRRSANCFYVSNSIWFIRFLLTRDNKKIYREKLKEIRKEILLLAQPDSIKNLSRNRYIEYLLLRYWFRGYVFFAHTQAKNMK